jgi:hypothetical protein
VALGTARAELRDEQQRLVLADLMGPAGGDEERVSARRVFDRLLALNHQRYTEEVAAGLHDKGKKGAAEAGLQAGMFD